MPVFFYCVFNISRCHNPNSWNSFFFNRVVWQMSSVWNIFVVVVVCICFWVSADVFGFDIFAVLHFVHSLAYLLPCIPLSPSPFHRCHIFSAAWNNYSPAFSLQLTSLLPRPPHTQFDIFCPAFPLQSGILLSLHFLLYLPPLLFSFLFRIWGGGGLCSVSAVLLTDYHICWFVKLVIISRHSLILVFIKAVCR